MWRRIVIDVAEERSHRLMNFKFRTLLELVKRLSSGFHDTIGPRPLLSPSQCQLTFQQSTSFKLTVKDINLTVNNFTFFLFPRTLYSQHSDIVDCLELTKGVQISWRQVMWNFSSIFSSYNDFFPHISSLESRKPNDLASSNEWCLRETSHLFGGTLCWDDSLKRVLLWSFPTPSFFPFYVFLHFFLRYDIFLETPQICFLWWRTSFHL